MPATLEKCRHYLEKVYRERLGVEFADSFSTLEAGRQPVWRFVSADDLTSDAKPGDGAVGALLDPEIGLLFYLAPFSSHTDLRQQIICAVALGARLSIQAASAASPDEPGDPRGAWRVVVCWLVDAGDRRDWVEQIAEIRRETPFSEDVSLDAIFVTGDDDLESQLDRYGFPRLLLTTREVLRKQRIEDVANWMSADDQVRAALAGFQSRFQKPEQRELAEGVVQVVEEFRGGSPDSENVVKFEGETRQFRTLDRIQIEGFRNLASITLDFRGEPVGATIISGANGTGKTSLCEAVSLALFGSSSAYRTFTDRTREKDIPVTDRAREYLTRYLWPLAARESQDDARPKIGTNDEPLGLPQLVSPDEARSADIAMDGTILHQDTSVEFARLPTQDLGARILRGYSPLADHVEEYVESRVQEANTSRQDFLRTFGLSASITKVDTAFERMARREIDRSLPGFPRPLVQWLDSIQIGARLAWRWQDWGNESSRNALAGRLSQLDASPSNLELEIHGWLEEYNRLVALSREVVTNVNARIEPVRSELDGIASRINAWGQWLSSASGGATCTVPSAERAGSEPGTPDSPQVTRLDALQAEQRRVVDEGQSVARHFDHLTQVDAFVSETWGKQHPNECPTCGQNHADRGGILPVIRSWREQTTAERERLRAEYSRLKSEIEALQKTLAGSGQGQCPIGPGEQSRIEEALAWLVPGQAGFRQWISAQNQREELLAIVAVLKHAPIVPPAVDAESEAARLAHELASQFADARKRFDAPSNWKPVKEKLTAMLADVVNQHLPRTLGALWSELVLNLTPAPWLLPDRPTIEVATRRGEQRSTLQVQGRLARYVLNQAEVHILGLGWFLSRYLTRGRFSHACLVMDDPAHALDQAGFRDLCRLWETLIRLHRVYGRPLRLIVTLGQETRAIQAARATGGMLLLLGWTPGQTEPLRTARLVPENVHPLQPGGLFRKAL